jgi:hypothetical protein
MLGTLMAIGAGTGLVSTFLSGKKQQAQIAQQKKMAWDQYLLGQNYADKQWGINRQEAKTSLGIQRSRLDQSVDQSMGQFNLGLLGQAYGMQDAQIQAASNVGASIAAEGMSGTRGNAANGLMRAYEMQSLERNIDLQQRDNSLVLQGMMGQASNAAADISRESASWDKGGYRYSQKAAQDDYNRGMAELGQANFDWAIAEAKPGWMDYAVGMFGGMGSGLNLAGSFNRFNDVGGLK